MSSAVMVGNIYEDGWGNLVRVVDAIPPQTAAIAVRVKQPDGTDKCDVGGTFQYTEVFLAKRWPNGDSISSLVYTEDGLCWSRASIRSPLASAGYIRYPDWDLKSFVPIVYVPLKDMK